jgi:hypothetical protein
MSANPALGAGEAVVIPSAWELDWTAIGTTDGNVPGPTLKILHQDVSSGGMTFLTHLPPNWHDDNLDFHPTSEEGFVIAGDVKLADRLLTAGCYLYRPPFILHGPVRAPNDLGCTIFQRTNGPLRIMYYRGSEFPQKDGQPLRDDHLQSDIPWSERTDTNALAWDSIEKGGWSGTKLRWIHRNRRTGGGFVMIDIPPGWAGAGSAARGPVEEFVLTGSLEAGGTTFGKWGYASRPQGQPAGRYAAPQGARLLSYWNGANEI